MYSNGSTSGSISSFHPGDVITVILDFEEDKLSFEINGSAQSSSLSGIKEHAPLYPGVCFYGSGRTSKILSGASRPRVCSANCIASLRAYGRVLGLGLGLDTETLCTFCVFT